MIILIRKKYEITDIPYFIINDYGEIRFIPFKYKILIKINKIFEKLFRIDIILNY